MNVSVRIRLEPISTVSPITGKTYYEKATVYIDDYPSFMIHCDAFYVADKTQREVANELGKGRKLEGIMTLEVHDVSETVR